MNSSHSHLHQQQQIQTPAFTYTPNRREVHVPPPPPIMTMSGNEMQATTEGMGTPAGTWATPTTQGMKPRPATIHEGFSYCSGEGFNTIQAWDPSGLDMQSTPSETMSRPVSMHQQEFYP
ncbi:hypothetical protein PG994_011671 [Apiospora phragmitis]|uniref:Uncharacterized protein n=1 Tax=Apiospora phragmitis TaxID=2905665 RepID=A0ABR1TVN1_9PEZI